MKFFTTLPGITRFPPISQEWESAMTPSDFQLVARVAEEAGFDSITIPEHIALPDNLTGTMGAFWPDALTAMAFVAGATTTIAVDSCIVILPVHNPVVFAKRMSTLDVMSGGRVRLTIGVGHAEREFEAIAQAPFHERGEATDEYLAAMIELWTSDQPTFKGRHVAFDGIAFEPKPVQSPYPPILVGGSSKAAMRRAARHDGWFPQGGPRDVLLQNLDYIRSQPEYQARTRPWDLVVSVGRLELDADHRAKSESGRAEAPESVQETIDAIGELAEFGVTWTSIPVPLLPSLEAFLDHLRRTGEEIIAPCH